MDYLERTKRVWCPIPIGYVNSEKVQKFVYDDFSEELKIFLKQQQKVLFSYPASNVVMKANYLNLYVRNKLNRCLQPHSRSSLSPTVSRNMLGW
jgi:hypothetical protein